MAKRYRLLMLLAASASFLFFISVRPAKSQAFPFPFGLIYGTAESTKSPVMLMSIQPGETTSQMFYRSAEGRSVYPVAWSPDSHLLATVDSANVICFLNRTGNLQACSHERIAPESFTLTWSADSHSIYTVSGGGTAYLIIEISAADGRTLQTVYSFIIPDEEQTMDNIPRISWTPDMSRIMAVQDGKHYVTTVKVNPFTRATTSTKSFVSRPFEQFVNNSDSDNPVTVEHIAVPCGYSPRGTYLYFYDRFNAFLEAQPNEDSVPRLFRFTNPITLKTTDLVYPDPLPARCDHLAWTQNEQFIFFTYRKYLGKGVFGRREIYRYELSTGSLELYYSPTPDANPDFSAFVFPSPDGRYVAFSDDWNPKYANAEREDSLPRLGIVGPDHQITYFDGPLGSVLGMVWTPPLLAN